MKKPPSKLRPGPGPTPPPCNRGWPEEKGQARGIGLPARKSGIRDPGLGSSCLPSPKGQQRRLGHSPYLRERGLRAQIDPRSPS